MRQIPLHTKDGVHGLHFAKVDDDDYARVARHRWFLKREKGGRLLYAKRNAKRGEPTLMHRFILELDPSLMTDHIDHDGLNNQRSNLRACNCSQNTSNQRVHRDSASGERCIYKRNRRSPWVVDISKGGIRHVRNFLSLTDAIEYRNAKLREIHGEFANLERGQ
jgi:hypothetical protein